MKSAALFSVLLRGRLFLRLGSPAAGSFVRISRRKRRSPRHGQLEIRIANHHSYMQLAPFFILDEIVRPRVGRQPVLVLKILAKCLEHREWQLRSVPGNLADEFSVTFYNP